MFKLNARCGPKAINFGRQSCPKEFFLETKKNANVFSSTRGSSQRYEFKIEIFKNFFSVFVLLIFSSWKSYDIFWSIWSFCETVITKNAAKWLFGLRKQIINFFKSDENFDELSVDRTVFFLIWSSSLIHTRDDIKMLSSWYSIS